MGEFFSFFWSPHGVVLFLVLWVIKAAFGVWLAAQTIRLLPVHWQDRPTRWLKMLTPKASHGVLMGKETKAQTAQEDVNGGPVK